MTKAGLGAFTDAHREALATEYARLFVEAFPDQATTVDSRVRVRQVSSWTVGFFHLLGAFLRDQDDMRVFEYQKTLVLSGDLSNLGVNDLVKACLLVGRAYQRVLPAAGEKTPNVEWIERLQKLQELLLVSATRFFDEKMRMNEKFVDQLFEGADLIFFILDTGGKIIRANDLVAGLFGVKREQLVGRNFAAFVHPDDLVVMTRSIGLVLSGTPRIFELRVRAAMNQTKILHAFLTPLTETGHIVGMRLVAQDVTTQRTLQEALRRSEEKFHALLEQAPSAILIVRTEDGSILEVNRRASELLDVHPGQSTRRTLLDVFAIAESTTVIELLQSAIHLGSAEKTGLAIAARSTLRVNAMASTIEYGDHRVVQLALTESHAAEESDPYAIRDRRLAAQEIRRLREESYYALAALAENPIYRDIFREVQTGLRAAEEWNLRPEGERDADELKKMLERPLRLIELAERIRRRRRIEDDVMDPAGALEDMVALNRELYGRHIVFRLRIGELSPVKDARGAILDGLIGVVRAAVESMEEGEIEIGAERHGNMDVIHVMDDGEDLPPGSDPFRLEAAVPRDERRRNFDYYRAAQRAAESAGGGLTLRAKKDGGAHVTITLPGARWEDVGEAGGHDLVVVPPAPEGEAS